LFLVESLHFLFLFCRGGSVHIICCRVGIGSII
jgi:hypothetical protein